MSDSASAARQLSHLCRLHARPDASRCLTVREGPPCALSSPDWLDRVDVAGRPAVRSAEPPGLDVGCHPSGRAFGPASTGGSWVLLVALRSRSDSTSGATRLSGRSARRRPADRGCLLVAILRSGTNGRRPPWHGATSRCRSRAPGCRRRLHVAASELRDLRLRCWSSARSVGAQRASTTPTPVKTRAMRHIPSSCSLETRTLRAPKHGSCQARFLRSRRKNHPCAVLLSLTGISLSGPESGKALPRRRR